MALTNQCWQLEDTCWHVELLPLNAWGRSSLRTPKLSAFWGVGLWSWAVVGKEKQFPPCPSPQGLNLPKYSMNRWLQHSYLCVCLTSQPVRLTCEQRKPSMSQLDRRRFIGKIALFPKHSQNPRELWEPDSKSRQGLPTALHVWLPVLSRLASSSSLKPTAASQGSYCHYPPLYGRGKQEQEEIKQFAQGLRGCELESIPGILIPKSSSKPKTRELQEWSTCRSLVRGQVELQFSIFLAPGTGFEEDSFPMNRGQEG